MPENEQSSIRRKPPLALTFFSLLAIGGLVSMPVLAGAPGGKELPDIVRFIGHFHPLVLHLPIGVFSLILFQELGAIFGGRGRTPGGVSLFPMFFGVASAIIAVIAGFMLYQGHGMEYGENPLAQRHLWGGLAFAVAALITFVIKAWTVAYAANPAWYRLVLFASTGIMAFASHDGASITHGADYLTRYAPPQIRRILGQEAGKSQAPASKPAAEQVVYADIVAPILERRCMACHKEGKAKGKLQMDTYELLVKGGKAGHGIEPGKPEKSEILVRMQLPQDDEDHMPPEGKPKVEDAELLVIKWWISNGADPHKKLADMQVADEIKAALAKLGAPTSSAGSAASTGHAPATAHSAQSAGPDDALKTSVAQLSKQFPGALSFESQESPLVTFTAVSLRGKFDDEMFAKLGSVLPQIVTLDLSATKITDKSVASLASARQLKMVRLSETVVTDSSIDALMKIPALESINLYGTKVTDAGVLKLASMPNLKRLYLWQTAVTPDAVKALKEKLPKCEIITGS